MKALILNSGLGSRMGVLTSEHPKCMTNISARETILSRQLRLLWEAGIKEVVITTGYYDQILVDYCDSLDIPLRYTFVNNPVYDQTNYIYSIYCAREVLDDDILLLHGDLVFEKEVLSEVMHFPGSCMTVSSTLPLPEKDFKAEIDKHRVIRVGIDIFENTLAAQPLYKLFKEDWMKWLERILLYCETDRRKVYAENALNDLKGAANIHALDVKNMLCAEIDNHEDWKTVSAMLREIEENDGNSRTELPGLGSVADWEKEGFPGL